MILSRARIALSQALCGMARNAVAQMAAIGAVAVGLLLLGIIAVVANNLDALAERWGRAASLTVYLEDTVAPRRARALERWLSARPEVAGVRYVSPAEAARRLRAMFGADAPALQELDARSLPASVEVRLAADVGARRARPLLALIGAAPGVQRVDDLSRWVRRMGSIVSLVRGVGVLLALVVGLACVYIVASAIRLGVHARREEIEIQRLVGATETFVRAPFILEGALQGLIGAVVAAVALFSLFAWVGPDLRAVLGELLAGYTPTFLDPGQLAVGVAAGATLGLAGSSLALGRYVQV